MYNYECHLFRGAVSILTLEMIKQNHSTVLKMLFHQVITK